MYVCILYKPTYRSVGKMSPPCHQQLAVKAVLLGTKPGMVRGGAPYEYGFLI